MIAVPMEMLRRRSILEVGGHVEDPRARSRKRGDDARACRETSEPHSA